MDKLEIKKIKGHKYLYIKYRTKVNYKSRFNYFYIGRFEKLTIESFMSKLDDLQLIKLTKFIEPYLKRQRQSLNEKQALDLEAIHYYYQLFNESFPDDIALYNNSVFRRYVQGTTAIEGNTITQRETDELLEHGLTPAGRSIREVYEIMNLKKLKEFLEQYDGDISENFIKQVHSTIMAELLESRGNYRRIQVLIEKAEHEPPPAFKISELMADLVKWYRKNRMSMNLFELAVLFHTKFVTIHPFVDGNGRVARALMNFILERNGYPTLYFGLEHRNAYLDAVAEGNKEQYQPIIGFMLNIYIDQHRQIMEDVKDQPSMKFPENIKLRDQFMQLRGLPEPDQ